MANIDYGLVQEGFDASRSTIETMLQKYTPYDRITILPPFFQPSSNSSEPRIFLWFGMGNTNKPDMLYGYVVSTGFVVESVVRYVDEKTNHIMGSTQNGKSIEGLSQEEISGIVVSILQTTIDNIFRK
ncbi:hypothetical protein COV17_02585 [Candidatus Woesearchaeota archaeon CG10_big_fil_rev_8_21_14_0_10_36_11]|nr:MAG: hypothetical protein COV17_02585 [Candidatus Woesearchaeota archaeon CG10_big_fil_rev_8_21_14_0_10_36_11]